MTKWETNKLIAEYLGWSGLEKSGILLPDPPYRGYPPKNPIVGRKVQIPDYCANLNAMHEAEQILDTVTSDQQSLYYDHLGIICGWKSENHFDAQWESTWNTFRATAAQRAEAFLRTIGKWKEDADEE